jgi:hypothetical protein
VCDLLAEEGGCWYHGAAVLAPMEMEGVDCTCGDGVILGQVFSIKLQLHQSLIVIVITRGRTMMCEFSFMNSKPAATVTVTVMAAVIRNIVLCF